MPQPIVLALRTAFPKPGNPARQMLEDVLPDKYKITQNGNHADKPEKDENPLPEIWAYLAVLVQVRRESRCTLRQC